MNVMVRAARDEEKGLEYVAIWLGEGGRLGPFVHIVPDQISGAMLIAEIHQWFEQALGVEFTQGDPDDLPPDPEWEPWKG